MVACTPSFLTSAVLKQDLRVCLSPVQRTANAVQITSTPMPLAMAAIKGAPSSPPSVAATGEAGGGEGASSATTSAVAVMAWTVTPRAEESAAADVALSVVVAACAAAADCMTMSARTRTLAEKMVSRTFPASKPISTASAVANASRSKEETSPARVKSARTTGRYSLPGERGRGEGGSDKGEGGDGSGDGDGDEGSSGEGDEGVRADVAGGESGDGDAR